MTHLISPLIGLVGYDGARSDRRPADFYFGEETAAGREVHCLWYTPRTATASERRMITPSLRYALLHRRAQPLAYHPSFPFKGAPFEWGSFTRGALRLAYGLLHDAYGMALAEANCVRFAEEIVATLRPGWLIVRHDLDWWLRRAAAARSADGQ